MGAPLIHIGVTHEDPGGIERLIVGFDGDRIVYRRRHPGAGTALGIAVALLTGGGAGLIVAQLMGWDRYLRAG